MKTDIWNIEYKEFNHPSHIDMDQNVLPDKSAHILEKND